MLYSPINTHILQIGTLRGFDDYVNMVLDDVVEHTFLPDGSKVMSKLESILLNGNNIAIMVPGGEPEEPEVEEKI